MPLHLETPENLEYFSACINRAKSQLPMLPVRVR